MSVERIKRISPFYFCAFYQIDCLMRTGLEQQLKSQSKAAITSIKLKIGAVKTGP